MDTVIIEMCEAFASAIDFRTGNDGHSARVARYVKRLAQQLGLSADVQLEMGLAALIHDIGQVFVPYELFRSTTSRTNSDFRSQIEAHTNKGAEFVRQFPHLGHLIPYIELHQEWVDGSGYPHHLSGDAIPDTVQLLSIADVYEALRHSRIYRGNSLVSHSQAIIEMKELRGKRWAPEIFDAFERVAHALED